MFTHITLYKTTIRHRYTNTYNNTRKTVSIIVDHNGIVEKLWYKNSNRRILNELESYIHICSGGAPAGISYYDNGEIRHKVWYKDGKIHHIGT